MTKLLAIIFTIVALVSCGSARAAGPATLAPSILSFHAAPVDGSPEQAAIDLGRSTSRYRVAPVEGSPEEAAIELGR